MIVKDEAAVIERCLSAVVPYIDAWLIVDTGSTDDTRARIERFMEGAGKPGEVVRRPWVDFGTNRSEALALSRSWANFSLVIDADEVFEASAGFSWPSLEGDAYQILHAQSGSDTRFYLTQLLRNSLPFRYQGVLHEVVVCDAPHRLEKIEGALITGFFDSARNQDGPAQKYAKDAQILERSLENDPDNARYAFYLAQSYRDAGQREKAADAYEKRSHINGFEEEAWYAELMRARLLEKLGRWEPALAAYLAAYERRPSRAETLCDLSRLHREKGQHHLAHLFANAAIQLEMPGDILFVEQDAYRWRAQDELAVSDYYLGRYAESLAASEKLLGSGDLPASERVRVQRNLEFARSRLS